MAETSLPETGRAARALSIASSGILIGVLMTVLTISFVAIVFQGQLAGFAGQGIAFALTGTMILAVIGAYTLSYPGTVNGPQDIPAVSLSVIATGLGTGWSAGPEALFATVAAAMVLIGIGTGLVFLASARFGLGRLARYLPYPVLSGFLGATGLTLILGALGLATGGPMDFAEAPARLAATSPLLWGPPLILGAVFFALPRLFDNGLLLPVALIAALAGFYALLGTTGTSLAEARGLGLLLGPFGAGEGLPVMSPALWAEADLGALASQLPAIATAVALITIGTLLNASGIEVATRVPVELDRELRGAGLANIGAGLVGGLAGYHHLGATILANRLGAQSRSIGLLIALVAAGVLFAGTTVLSNMPIAVLAGLSVFIGIGLLDEAIWQNRKRLPWQDFAVVLLIVVVAATAGFLAAVGIGAVACVILFTVICAKGNVVSRRYTGADRQSMVARTAAETEILRQNGTGTLIYELQGHMFFGTANRLTDEVQAELKRTPVPKRILLDFRRVQGLDSSAAYAFGMLGEAITGAGSILAFSDLDADSKRQLLGSDGDGMDVRVFKSIDAALDWAETETLAETGATDLPQSFRIESVIGADGAAFFETLKLAPYEVLITQGDAPDTIDVLEEGRVAVYVHGENGSKVRLTTMIAGAVIGEIGFYTGVPRTASVVAETPCTVRRLTRPGHDRMQSDCPEALLRFHVHVARDLAHRLNATTNLVQHTR